MLSFELESELTLLPVDDEVEDERVDEDPAPAVVVGLYTEVTTTVTGANEDSPAVGVWVTTDVMSSVEPGTADADTTEVTTFVDEGSTVTVLAPATIDDTDDAAADEKEDCAEAEFD